MIKKGDKKSQLLESIPGIGRSMARDLRDLGIYQVSDLLRKDPSQLYDSLCKLRGNVQDRCVLYVFKCAVYYAEQDHPDPELLKWWNWKDK